MFPLPRVVYAMASDGLIFRKFSSVNARTKTPMFATIISGILAGNPNVLNYCNAVIIRHLHRNNGRLI